MPFNEKELILELKNGSYRAFTNIYEMYSARLYAYCYRYTHSNEDSEEIVQDVFTRLWMNKNKIRQEETLQSLIFIMAKNHLINTYRSRVNSFVFEEYVNYYNEEKLSVNNTHHQVEYDEFCTILDKALKSLSDTQRKVIEYCKLKQLSNKEAAQKLGVKEQTLKNQLSTSLKLLKEALKNNWIWIIVLLFVK